MHLMLLLLFTGSPAARAAGTEADPFAGVAPSSASARAEPDKPWSFFSDNFGFRKELMSEFGASDKSRSSSRQSAGFEVLKKFSSETRTFAAVDFQGRLVRRDLFSGSPNDAEGAHRPGWFFEYHNAYADLYNVLDPVLTEDQQSRSVGRFNARAGRFYVPFGLNLQTDTHGSLLQLSNERNFGFERDWYSGLWGALTDDLNYDAYYLNGSGYDLKNRGQSGLGAARLSLSNHFSNEHGLEGGLSYLAGERLDPEAAERSPAIRNDAGPSSRVDTARAGLDARYRHPVPTGSVAWTSELSGGRDAPDSVFTQLHQLDYLRASRRWGLAAQFRRFWQDMSRDRALASPAPGSADSSVSAEGTWYFRNDPGNSNLHWIKLNVERRLERMQGDRPVIVTLQYYRYW
ncbi:MAG: hypothetical protein HY077_12850 [Elusimicrobia bacterium]|nr:hypothetical protein [Elusimicrobiota bacterium]